MLSTFHTDSKIVIRLSVIINIIIAALFITACSSSADSRKDGFTKSPHTQRQVEGEYIITLQGGKDESVIRTAFSDYIIVSIRQIRKNTYLIKLEKDPGLEELLKEAHDSKEIIRIQPNYIYKAL